MSRRMPTALSLGALLLGAACVQPAYDRVVVYRVAVPDTAVVKTVGLRGQGNPLSWNSDLPMAPVPDSAGLYEVTVIHHTGSLVNEVKFTLNGQFEFEGEANRTVRVPPTTVGNDTTLYRATFNVR
jgi:putative oxidoreductase